MREQIPLGNQCKYKNKVKQDVQANWLKGNRKKIIKKIQNKLKCFLLNQRDKLLTDLERPKMRLRKRKDDKHNSWKNRNKN